MIKHQRILGAFLFVATFSVACAKRPTPEGYRIVSYDAPSQQWTIIRNGTFDGKYLTKRLIVTCSFYKLADQKAVTGPYACHLQVGRMIVPNPFPKERGTFLDVFEMPN